EVLKGVNLTLDKGGTVALLGSNGSGKSTLMRCCLRLIEPDTGEVAFFGETITGSSRHQARRIRASIGFVFQKHFLVPRLSALTNVLHGVQSRSSGPRTWLQSIARQEDREEALHCLDRVGLADQAGKRVDQLSGGQSQRVAIARALMQRPRLLMADEPVASLDPKAAEDVMGLFQHLAQDEGLTLIYTTHNLEHALAYSERVVMLKNGTVVHEGLSGDQHAHTLRRFYEHENAPA
ncbi:MAG: ATP-binding cassette domain-containing protein, partial [Pseudomonadota bacterium]